MNEERVADRTATAAYQHAIAEAHSRGDLSDAEADSANRALEIWADDSSEVYLHRLERLLDHYTRLKSRRELAMRVYMELGVDDAMTEALLAERIEKTNWLLFGRGYLEREVRVIRTLRLADMRPAGDDVSRVLAAASRDNSRRTLARTAPMAIATHGQAARSGDRGGGHRQSRRSSRRVTARGSSRGDPDQSDGDPPGDSSQSSGRGVVPATGGVV
jgi:hypothetical protein